MERSKTRLHAVSIHLDDFDLKTKNADDRPEREREMMERRQSFDEDEKTVFKKVHVKEEFLQDGIRHEAVWTRPH